MNAVKVLIGIVAALGVLCIVGAVLIYAVSVEIRLAELNERLDTLPIYEAAAAPEDIEVDVTVPPRVAIGDAFTIEVVIRNDADVVQLLDSIDVDQSYLEGITLLGSEPPSTAPDDYETFMSYRFERRIPAGEELVVRFRARAETGGRFVGDLDVCIDDPASCLSRLLDTEVSDGGT